MPYVAHVISLGMKDQIQQSDVALLAAVISVTAFVVLVKIRKKV